VLLHRHRVVGAALDGGVVRDDHALPAGHPADPGDDAGRRRSTVVQAVCGQRRQLQERAPGIQQRIHTVTRQQLPALDVPRPRPLATPASDHGELLVELVDEGSMGSCVARAGIDGSIGRSRRDRVGCRTGGGVAGTGVNRR
jgi:hypothetical protein